MPKKSVARGSSAKIYKLTELVGSSERSFAEAADAAVARATRTLRNVDWFEVCELRGAVSGGKIAQYQVKLKVGFRLD
jgi:flavin-binding protein dodecin